MKLPSSRTVLVLAAAVAAISVGLAAGPLPWRFAGDSGLPAPDAVPPAGEKAASISIDPIIALSPFGRLPQAADPAPQAQEETSLGLTLLGVVISTDPASSSAILSSELEPATVYVVGDSVASTAVLDSVFVDHVVLKVDGRQETLSFPENIQSPAAAPDPVTSGVDALRALATGETDAATDATDGSDDYVDPVTMMERYRTEMQNDPQTALDDLGLQPTDQGYQVGDGAPDTLLQAGLQPGDVIAKVNGQQVGNIEQDQSYFDEVMASGRARIEVLRNGQRIVLSFPLR